MSYVNFCQCLGEEVDLRLIVVMNVQVMDFSTHDREEWELDSLTIDPIIVHLVTVHGDSWTNVAQESGADSNLRSRALASMAQLMDYRSFWVRLQGS